MGLASPEWLTIAIAVVFAGWRWPTLKLMQPLRFICCTLALLVLVDPYINSITGGLDLWVLVDRSASAKRLETNFGEWSKLLERTKLTNDRIYRVDFADVAELHNEGNSSHYAHVEETRLALGIDYVLSHMDQTRANRILVCTDGYSTESLKAVTERVQGAGVPVDYRLIGSSGAVDYQIAAFKFPQRVESAESFMLELEVTGDIDGKVPYHIVRDHKRISSGEIEVIHGRGVIRLADRLLRSGSYQYRADIVPRQDTIAGNNVAEGWVEIVGAPRILLITEYDQDPILPALEKGGMEVEVVKDPAKLNAGSLTAARGILINNVPAYRFSQEFLAALNFYVSAQGGGLVLIGGENSFGSGGYYNSPLDPLLPVSMELRDEHRKLSVAMVLVLDRSGSMGMSVSGNMGSMTKMDLADEGAARTASLLGARDMLSIIAVDSEPHIVVPLTVIKGHENEILSSARSIRSAGGGIFVYQGLKAAWNELKAARAGQKHVILFADAADAEEPGEYQVLVNEMTKAKTTVTVIGLGSESDSDAAFLKDVALIGKGRIFFVSNAVDLPAVFAQETVSVARSAFIDDPVGLTANVLARELGADLEWPTAVDGYNLSYLKPEASAAAFSKDEYKAPLVSFWQRGAGRVGAVLFPLGGDFSEHTRTWTGYGEFVQTIARWILRPELPAGISIKEELAGNTFMLDLYYNQFWEKEIAQHAPVLKFSEQEGGTERMVAWQRMQPGHFRSTYELKGGKVARGVVQVGRYALPFGPFSVKRNAEWSFDRARQDELKQLSIQSGGAERVDLVRVWEVPRRLNAYFLRPLLIVVLLSLFIVEILFTRLNYRFHVAGWGVGRMPQWRKKERYTPPQKSAVEDVLKPREEEPVEVLESKSMQRRFERAKRGGTK